MRPIYQYSVIKRTETSIVEALSGEEIVSTIRSSHTKIIWVVDKKVSALIPLGGKDVLLEIEGGEQCKTLKSMEWLIGALAKANLDRTGHIVAVGGGSISDLVGYVASVYLRGISFSIVPTTLLSLIDASMGGKNGINFESKKNQLGSLHQPSTIYYWPERIITLPKDEMADGFAEIIKYGLIMDKPLFEKLETSDMAQMMGNIGDFNEIINSCIIHKSSIIMKDTYEVGLRRILNFGHTVGHAIEAIYGLSHGKAVALGMCFAVRLSERYYGFEGQISQKIEKVLAAFHLPSRLDSFSASALFEKIASDKKRENKHIHFVLLEEVGRARVEKLSMNHLKNLLEIAEKEKWMC